MPGSSGEVKLCPKMKITIRQEYDTKHYNNKMGLSSWFILVHPFNDKIDSSSPDNFSLCAILFISDVKLNGGRGRGRGLLQQACPYVQCPCHRSHSRRTWSLSFVQTQQQRFFPLILSGDSSPNSDSLFKGRLD